VPTYVRADIQWSVLPKASGVLARVRGEYPNENAYREDRKALQDFLCAYFSDVGCQRELGKGISPIGATKLGCKLLKVRWNRPGQGKSAGLRMIVVADCDAFTVKIAFAYLRAQDASDAEVAEATKDL
jgi:hypothetical protein